jgi:hypothetical protein
MVKNGVIISNWLLTKNNGSYFLYDTRKTAEKDMRIFNNEKCEWEEDYHLYKLIR